MVTHYGICPIASDKTGRTSIYMNKSGRWVRSLCVNISFFKENHHHRAITPE